MLNEFEDLAYLATNDENSAEYIKTAGIYDVTIKKAELSPEGETKPYINLVFATADGLISTFRLGRVYPGLSEAAIKIRKENLKQLFDNAGVAISNNSVKMVNDLVGKKVRALFKERFYITVDKDCNNMPIKRSKIEYSYCRKIGTNMNAKESYFTQDLSDKELRQYQSDLMRWEKMNPTASKGVDTSRKAEVIEDDEEPF